MKKQTFKFLTLFILFVSCSTMTLNIDSEPPKANVFVKEGQKLKKIGETPMTISSENLKEFKQYNISIQKEGYKSHEVLIDKRALSAKANISATLQKDLSTQNMQTNNTYMGESNQRSLASIQTELLNNNYSQAEVLAKTFLNDNPYSPVGWNLLGNAYLLQNQNGLALEAYTKALSYDSENQDTQKMIEYLKGSPVRRDR
jgi:predicted Zn-dependent protease